MPQAPNLEPFEYVLKEERGLLPEKQTRFHLRPLRFREWEQIQKRKATYTKDDGVQLDLDAGTLARRVLNWGLLGWDNFPGAPAFQRVNEQGRDIVPDHMLDLVTPWANELANAITERTVVSEESAKNS